ncbi:hypothetical protein H9Q13_17560 [Pontibacter sp. JH31]|uniref:Uncharacterized protein n=1 Tax=Pontibacter aquaedesilientis TaxID=2766980 RepID=A0ABR7XL22_9BACT|nr:hypothetical protein [Pontibacter aquaedesilientis]MBD1398980.1 hypothetical protein [Pontibacter aquaedesilientis]
MKSNFNLLAIITVVLLLSACTSHSFMLTERDVANDGVNPIQRADFTMVANKPAHADADAKWMAASKPHVVATSSRVKRRTDAVALSAATTIEGHEILKREIERAMKKDKTDTNPSKKKVESKAKKQSKPDSRILL